MVRLRVMVDNHFQRWPKNEPSEKNNTKMTYTKDV